ncbi:MAG: DUF1015 domain-containing protein [Spirochaetales bacterium]|nr:DUF1015 domain-containing protein [Spirochaetales bacterium]
MEQPVNDVRAFRALHYNPARVKDIGACLSQPYDVISPAAQAEYYRRDEHNVIRLILGVIEKTDDERNNRYARAADFLESWKREGVLTTSERPSFFAYEQTFSLPGGESKKLSGFIGLVRLSAYGEGKVLPHELVMKKPVQDRVALTRATRTQFEYIWGMYRDPAGTIDGLLGEAAGGNSLIDYTEPATGVRHAMYRIADAGQCRAVEEAMRDKKIYIADGHHRYQTMLDVRDEFRRTYPDAGPDAPWEFIMMFLVNSSHPGLAILPTHRLLHGCSDQAIETLRRELPKRFSVERYPFKEADEREVRARWLAAVETKRGPAIGVAIRPDREYLLIELSDAAAYRASVSENATDEWKMLDVNVLNILVLREILGFTDEMMSLQSNIEYCKDADDALGRVGSGEAQAAFILKGTPLSSVLAVADADEKMPRKSTFFYPKPLSGLVFYEMR